MNYRISLKTALAKLNALAFISFLLILIPVRATAELPPNEIKDIRYFVTTDYIRVVIDVTENMRFKKGELAKSKKLFFDLEDARVGQYSNRTIELNNDIIRRIRVAQFDPKTVRVVLDLDDFRTYRFFMLSDPERIVIDVLSASSRPAADVPVTATTKKSSGNSSATLQSPGDMATQASIQEQQRTASKDTSGKYSAGKENTAKDSASNNNVKESTKENKAQASLSPPSDASHDSIKGSYKHRPGQRKTVVLDAGHGGKDPGAISSSGLMEKDITLDVVLVLKKILEKKYGYVVHLTRSSDVTLPLDQRPIIANSKNADLFVSVHVNANDTPSVCGIETYFLNFTNNEEAIKVAARENAISIQNLKEKQTELGVILASLAMESKRDESLRLSHYIQKETVSTIRAKYSNVKDNGVKKGPFYVLYGATMPAALVEISYLTNPDDERRLATKAFRQQLATAIAKGVARYFNSKPDTSEEYAEISTGGAKN